MDLTPEHEQIRDSVRRLAEQELAPIAARIDADDWFPRDFFRRLGEIGALGVVIVGAVNTCCSIIQASHNVSLPKPSCFKPISFTVPFAC